MNNKRRTLLALATFVTFTGMFVLSQNLTMAGNLNPPAAPAPTMHTLDEIYNASGNGSSGLPSPDEVTLVLHQFTIPFPYNPWQTIYTVSAGKTFYLLGINIESQPMSLSFDGGNTYHFSFQHVPVRIVSSYPITSVAGPADIKAMSTSGGGGTIWGYEK